MSFYIHKEKFAERFSEVLKNSDETIYSIAEKVYLAPGTISKYKRGVIEPKITTVFLLADIFKVNPQWLMGYDVLKEPCEKMHSTPSAIAEYAERHGTHRQIEKLSKEWFLEKYMVSNYEAVQLEAQNIMQTVSPEKANEILAVMRVMAGRND